MRRLIRLAIYTDDAAGFGTNWELHAKKCGAVRASDLLEGAETSARLSEEELLALIRA